MPSRWRGHSIGLAIMAAVLAGSIAPAITAGGPQDDARIKWELVVRGAEGEILVQAPLPDDRFALRYRNSVYGSLAEERFTVTGDGTISLTMLGAEEAAVLEEYYAVDDRPSRATGADDARLWLAAPAGRVEMDTLRLSATEHGRRTLVISGRPSIPLWRLVGDGAPHLTLAARPAP